MTCQYWSTIAQNLIPNGDFESGEIPCEFPLIRSADLLDAWFAPENTDVGYDHVLCEKSFGESPLLPRTGQGSGHISGGAWVNGLLFGNIMLNKFSESLIGGKKYFFRFYGKSKGIRHVAEEALMDCDINPSRDLSFYLAYDDSEFSIQQIYGKQIQTDVEITLPEYKLDFDVNISIFSFEENWQKYTTCIDAIGGEEILGIAGPNRFFNVTEPCVASSDDVLDSISLETFSINRFFHFYSYQIDDVGLYEIPDELEVSDTICLDELNLVQLRSKLPESPIYEDAIFIWDDGQVDDARVISDPGTYSITVDIGCATIPLRLDIDLEECPPPFYAPNIFSPNDDGFNDFFSLSFDPYYNLKDYELAIYDNWGSELFKSNDPSEKWNGMISGRKAEVGVYVWRVSYLFNGFSRAKTNFGSVQVVR